MDINRGLVFFAVLTTLTLEREVEGATITITPSRNLQIGSSVTIRCAPSSSIGITKIYSIQIKNVDRMNTSHLVGSIDVAGNPSLANGLSQSKYTISGSLPSISQISGSYFQVVINHLECSDQIEYKCITPAANSGGSISPIPEDSKKITIQGSLSNIQMTMAPNKVRFNVNDSVRLRCTGNVGSPAKRWNWQWKQSAKNNWERYPNSQDITTGRINQPSGEGACSSYTQDTTLNYVIKAGDNGIQIKCILDNNDKYSSSLALYTANNPNTGEVGDGNGSNSVVFKNRPVLIVFIISTCLVKTFL